MHLNINKDSSIPHSQKAIKEMHHCSQPHPFILISSANFVSLSCYRTFRIMNLSTLFVAFAVLTSIGLIRADDIVTSSSTVLTCEPCIADGKGQAILQERCDNGAYDNFCKAGDCFCPFTDDRRAMISCESDACLDANTLRVTNFSFQFLTRPPRQVVKFEVQAKAYDKVLQSAGDCDATTKVQGTMFIYVRSSLRADSKSVEAALKEAAGKASKGNGFVCEATLREIASQILG